MTKIYLTHSPDALKNYYGDRALTQLRALGEVKLNPFDRPLSSDELIREAQGQDIVVASRDSAAPAALFDQLPELIAFCRGSGYPQYRCQRSEPSRCPRDARNAGLRYLGRGVDRGRDDRPEPRY